MAEVQLPDANGGSADVVDNHNSVSSSTLDLKNQLADSSSPYLRSHKDNPVAWQEWSPETLALARMYERPIFLSIGYSACHWCHVMSHESFDNPEIAAQLNNSFIPIKVDRESRPDLDDIYMNYVTATTGSGGWPLNVFITPDLQPLFGGTYWPSPSSEMTLPNPVDATEDRPLNFLDIVHKIKDIWQNERQRCLASASDITHQLQAFAAEGIHAHSAVQVRGLEDENEAPEPLDLDLLDDALDHFVARYDSKHGGFTSASVSAGPKFPTPANLTFLLRIGASITRPSTHTRFGFPSPVPGILGKKSCATAARMAHHTLQSMSRSALHDHLGNGFHRYSVTPDWNLPHFEKMLYDNAQLLAVYCDAWALGRDAEVLGTIYDLVEYLTSPDSPIVRKDGGWYASESADSLLSSTGTTQQEKKEGAYYVWTTKELKAILGDRDSSVVARHFGVEEHGNVPQAFDIKDEFISQNVLHIAATPSVLAKEFGLKDEEVVQIIKDSKKKLAEYRKSNRAAPEVDNKIILSWNALAISALGRAANTLASIDESRAKTAREAAERATAFIKANMFNASTGKLTRIYSDDTAQKSSSAQDLAFVDDYAYLIHSTRTLYDLTLERQYLDWTLQLQATLDRDFSAGRNGGYFQAVTTPFKSQIGIVSPPLSPDRLALSKPNEESTIQKMREQILNLKPGTDNALPSPNGVIASNLLYLSCYVSALSSNSSSSSDSTTTTASPAQSQSSTLLATARNTIDAFAPEIIQHPFLYPTLLSAIVMDTVTVLNLVVPTSMPDADIEARGLRGFGRTVTRAEVPDGQVLRCDTATGTCRVLGDGELEELEDGFEDEEGVPEVSAEVIMKRDEMARRESLALAREEGVGRGFGSGDGRPVVSDVPPA